MMTSVISIWLVLDLLDAPFPSSIPKGRLAEQALSIKIALVIFTLIPMSSQPNKANAAITAVDFPVSDSPRATGMGQQPNALMIVW